MARRDTIALAISALAAAVAGACALSRTRAEPVAVCSAAADAESGADLAEPCADAEPAALDTL